MKRIVVLGAGESGTGAAILAKEKGFEVFVSDCGTISDPYRALLDQNGIAWEDGRHSEELILNADEVVKSPGIPLTAPLIQKLQAQGTPIISEIEFAARYTNAKMICITGSNGKTTTTSLIYYILRNAGLNVPDHLDRYDFKFQNYVDAKFRITRNQTADDAFIYWAEDPVIDRELGRLNLGATLYPYGFSCPNPLPVGEDELALKGRHNVLNSMAATIAANVVGIRKEIIRESLKSFQGVEHRLQYVATVRGVRFINDSKATNVNSCWYALESMNTPTVLILGGKDKGNDYSEIDELVRAKCHTLVFMGLHNEKLHEHFDRFGLNIIDTNNLHDAINGAYNAAKEGDTVLLSPCCASFDLFKSYEDRGEQFMAAVRAL